MSFHRIRIEGLQENVRLGLHMSSKANGSNPGDIDLDHLTLNISSAVLDDAFRRNLVSKGCFGAVYRVPYDGVLCAAKYQNFEDNAYKLRQFQRECLLHSKLHHPNIVRMIGVCYSGNDTYQSIKVMELLELNLLSVVCTVPMYVKLTIIQDVSRGLHYLHTRNPPIVHACLTMQVVFLTGNLVAKVGGFTFLIEMVPENKRLQKPWSFSVRNKIFKASLYSGLPFDIYSFGCVMCEIIADQRFYSHLVYKADGRAFTVHAVNSGQYKRFINKIKDRSLKQLVTDCMDDNPDHRPSISLISEIISNTIESKYVCYLVK